MMKNKTLYKEHFLEDFENYRKMQGYSHEKMAELLGIVPRSYADLATGKYSPSFVTAIQYLLVLTDEQILKTMHNLHEKVEIEENNESL